LPSVAFAIVLVCDGFEPCDPFGFHRVFLLELRPSRQGLINRFPCQALPRRFYGIPNVCRLEIVVVFCMATSCRDLKA
jgi:hypothetical protein